MKTDIPLPFDENTDNLPKRKRKEPPTAICSKCGKSFPYSDLKGWSDIILNMKPICDNCKDSK